MSFKEEDKTIQTIDEKNEYNNKNKDKSNLDEEKNNQIINSLPDSPIADINEVTCSKSRRSSLNRRCSKYANYDDKLAFPDKIDVLFPGFTPQPRPVSLNILDIPKEEGSKRVSTFEKNENEKRRRSSLLRDRSSVFRDKSTNEINMPITLVIKQQKTL